MIKANLMRALFVPVLFLGALTPCVIAAAPATAPASTAPGAVPSPATTPATTPASPAPAAGAAARKEAENLIPYADLMVGGSGPWPEITRRRTPEQIDRVNAEAEERLKENLQEVTAEDQGLEKVMNYLRDNMGGNIFIDWPSLAGAGVDRQSRVTISLKNVSFEKVI